MRGRHALWVLAFLIVAALFLAPFIGERLEPNDDSLSLGGYIFLVVFCTVLGFTGWGIAYFHRGATAVDLARYIVGNLLLMVSVMLLMLAMWGGTDIFPDGLMCLLFIAPLVGFGIVSARWNDVKYAEGKQPPPAKGKQAGSAFEQSITLHGFGTEVSLPVFLEMGQYRLGYSFAQGMDVTGCEIFLLNTGNVSGKKRSIALPESNIGAVVFTVSDADRHVFEVDGVNDAGENLEWELTIDRL